MTGLRVDARARRGSFGLDVQLDVDAGQVVALVGPNGAGKTTLLRLIAGLTRVADGVVALAGRTLDDGGETYVAVEKRPVSVVFQDYRLFPHLSVIDNVGFPARAAGERRRAARESARPWLGRFDLDALADRRPGQLSGGQAQRVALARALAAGPEVLLLDEPLAALDAQTRVDVRMGLRRHLHDFDGVCLVVTHDPLEALMLADRLVVLERGRITQQGAPGEVARRPATDYVASLVGLNLYRGESHGDGTVALDQGGVATVASTTPRGPVLLAVRPAAVAVYAEPPLHGSPRNVWPGVVSGIEMLADRVRLHVAGTVPVQADITPAAVAELGLGVGSSVWCAVKSTEIEAYSA